MQASAPGFGGALEQNAQPPLQQMPGHANPWRQPCKVGPSAAVQVLQAALPRNHIIINRWSWKRPHGSSAPAICLEHKALIMRKAVSEYGRRVHLSRLITDPSSKKEVCLSSFERGHWMPLLTSRRVIKHSLLLPPRTWCSYLFIYFGRLMRLKPFPKRIKRRKLAVKTKHLKDRISNKLKID